MNLRIVAIASIVGLSGGGLPLAATETEPQNDLSICLALDGASDLVDRAVEQLRAQGPAGLAPLFAQRERMRERLASVADAQTAESLQRELERIETLIDRVAGQRYASISRLYWYTDFEQAKAAAAATGKPILSLRLLGKLTDEFSCANSRFFRTTLYANSEVSRRLAERFVLHWKSVRPAPRVTIDFGDGRKLERTVTGNSIHYVLTADGQPLDGLPGLYGPRQFLDWLTEMNALHGRVASLSPVDRWPRLRRYHAERDRQLARGWTSDLSAVALEDDASHGLSAGGIDDEVWSKIAALPEHAVELDGAARAIIRRENPTAAVAGARAMTKAVVENPLLRLLTNLQTSIAVDTVRNEYTLHRQLHRWFASAQGPRDVDVLNERVYAELFLTPTTDPWLGLAPPDAYTALKNCGVLMESK